MSSSTDRAGYCDRCGCANGQHAFGRCRGKDKKGSKRERCGFEWARCTAWGHSDISGAQYIDCRRCRRHPGGNPEHFWGTQPDDDPPVPTADEIGLPYPQESAEPDLSQYEAGPSNLGHTRTVSVETASTDPLQWSPERIEGESISRLAEDFGHVHIDDNPEPAYVDTYYSKDQRRVCFQLSTDQEIRTRESEWTDGQILYEDQWVACLYYNNDSGQFFTWRHGTGAESTGKGKGKGKEKKDKKGRK